MIRTRFYTSILCAAFFLVIIIPASANIATRSLTSFFIIEKDGSPYNENINYTISCSLSPSFKPSDYDSSLFSPRGNTNPWTSVFTLSGLCSSEDCRISKTTYYHRQNQKNDSKSDDPVFICLLNGSTGNISITTWNETGTSEFPCNKLTDYYDISVVMNGKKGYYNYTPEYLDCSRNLMKSISYRHYSCEEYLEKYRIDHLTGNFTQIQCAEIYDREITQCYQSLREVNLS